jgi:hypothetical protein
MKNKKFEQIEFTAPSYYACALCDGDFSGLDDREEQEIENFVAYVVKEHGHANFIYDFETEIYFSHRNDVNNLAGDVCKLTILKRIQ